MRHSFVNIEDLRRRAKRRIPGMLFDYIEGGADDEHTIDRNRAAFGDVQLRPRALVDVSHRSQRTTVLGEALDTPILLAPIGLARLAGRGGEAAAARAAAKHGTVSIVSTAASIALETIAKATTRPQWFQLYPWGDRATATRLMKRAYESGYQAMVVTVDVPVTGNRERDLRSGMTVPPRPSPRNLAGLVMRPRWLAELATGQPISFANLTDPSESGRPGLTTLAQRHQALLNPGHVWEDLHWMREAWPGPILLKGVMNAADGARAIDHGCDGVIVSNHGGRQLDDAPATLRVLSSIVDAIADRGEVLVDGGIRRGSDVVKALALGASAVMIGRPWLYGLAAAGEPGVNRALEILSDEIDRTLALVGVPNAMHLDRESVELPPDFCLA